jgi:hypothetical protein
MRGWCITACCTGHSALFLSLIAGAVSGGGGAGGLPLFYFINCISIFDRYARRALQHGDHWPMSKLRSTFLATAYLSGVVA